VEIAVGDLSTKIQITDFAGLQTVTYSNVVWQGKEVSTISNFPSVQGSKSGTDIALVLNTSPCTNVILQGVSSSDRLEIQAGKLDYKCAGGQAGTLTWNAFTFTKQ
jgi:hypothetical protein